MAAALAAVNIALLVGLLTQRELVLSTVGKVVFLLSALALPAVAIYAAFHANMRRSMAVSFCTSCHVMEAHGKSLEEDDDEMIPAIHYQNNWVKRHDACWECHTEYTLFGPLKAKLNGLRHMAIYSFGTPPEKLELYTPYSNRECLRCHGESKQFDRSRKHRQDDTMTNRIRAGTQSCMDKGCHDVVHEVYDDEETNAEDESE